MRLHAKKGKIKTSFPQFKIVAIFALSFISLHSCQAPEPIVDPEKGQKVVTSIIISDDFEIEDELPLSEATQTISRADGNDIYAFQIYARETSDPIDAYKPYAYGLFDDLSNVAIEMTDDKRYKIWVSMVRDAKNTIKMTATGYWEPFLIGLSATKVENQFVYSTTKSFKSLNIGRSAVNETTGSPKTYDRPKLSRYMGEISNFEPAADKQIKVALKRVVFGIRILSSDLSEGHIEFSIDGAPKMTLTAGQGSVEEIFTLAGDEKSSAWIEDSYTETIVCTAKWFKKSGSSISIGPSKGREITVKRKHMLPIEINTKSDPTPNFVVLEDDKLIEQEQIVF